MEIGISTACFFNREPVERALAKIASFGVRTTECFFASMCEYDPPYIDEIERSARTLRVHSVHAMCTQFEPQLFAVNPRQRADADAIFERFLCAAGRLGAANYTFHGPLKIKNKAFRHDYERLGSVMNNLTTRAARQGLKICYENVHYSNANDPAYLRELFARCPDLGAVLDVKQAVQAAIPYRAYLDVMGERLRTVHLCDMKGLATCLPGQGTIDFVRLFADLKERRFNGAVLLEVYPADYSDYDELLRAYDYLRECAAKAE